MTMASARQRILKAEWIRPSVLAEHLGYSTSDQRFRHQLRRWIRRGAIASKHFQGDRACYLRAGDVRKLLETTEPKEATS
jgi:hypothetical protein